MNTDICLRKTWRWIVSIGCAFLFLQTTPIYGAPVDEDLAQLVAQTQVTALVSTVCPDTMSIRDRTGTPLLAPDTGRVLGYVFAVRPSGYIVVAADTGLEPVIAFSAESGFSWNEAESNILLHLLCADLESRMAALDANALPSSAVMSHAQAWTDAVTSPAAVLSETPIGPLLQASTWSGGNPWNALCPIDPATGRSTAVGCVATATAQIIAYWGYPATVSFCEDDSYVTATRQIAVDATTASIAEIEYGGDPWTNPDSGMMAALSYAAGVSVAMDYTSSGSGAHLLDVAVALAGGETPYTRSIRPGVWEYASAELRTYEYSFWGTPFYMDQQEFFNELADNMAAGTPAELAIVSDTGGHAIVCDGFDEGSGMFHLNFGWGGTGDGWYSLPTEIPYEYNVITYAVMDIAPPSEPTPEPPTLLPASSPIPADGAIDVSTAGLLGFGAGNAGVGVTYDVYLGTDAQLVEARNAQTYLGAVGPSDAAEIAFELEEALACSTQYFWAVDSTADNDRFAAGSLWSMTTVAEAFPDPGEDVTLEPVRLEFGADGGAATVAVTAASAWTTTCSASWIEIDAETATGAGNGSFTYSVSPNGGTDAREAEICVEQATHIVVQAGLIPERLPSPILSPGSGEYVGEVQVSMSCAREDAVIRFTLDGSEPMESSPLYGVPVSLTESATVKAKAFLEPAVDGWAASEISEAVYTLISAVATPEFHPPEGTYSRSVEIHLTCATDGAQVCFTTDGTEPTPASPCVSSGDAILVEHSVSIRAKGFLEGWAPSATAVASYEITVPHRLEENTENGPGRWTASGNSGSVTWHITQRQSRSGSSSWWFGDEARGTYYAGRATPEGTLTSPEIAVAGEAAMTLSFWQWRYVESYTRSSRDRTTVEVRFDGGSWQSVWGQDSKDPSPRAWEQVAMEVEVPEGAQAMQVRFGFDAVTYSRNSYGGWYVDDILVERGPLPGTVASSIMDPLSAGAFNALVHPNPIRQDAAWVEVAGDISVPEELRVEVFDLSGRRVWEADAADSSLIWSGENRNGERVANGVYLMSIHVRVADAWVALPIEKVAILR